MIRMILRTGRTLGLALLMLFLTVLTVSGQGSDSQKAGKSKKADKEICITFDELPASRGFGEVDVNAVTYLILEALKKHEVKAAGFVVGSSVEGTYDILGQWLNAGHTLGNMTYSNQDLHGLGIEQFINDIKMGAEAIEPMLSGFGQKERYFRYPFLHYGATVDVRKQVELYLGHGDVQITHATVVPEDYVYNFSLEKLGKVPDTIKFNALLNEYLNHVLDEVERCEQVAREIGGRAVRHILLLRANRLNAVFLDELLTALEDMDYKFVSLDRAQSDKVYKKAQAYYGTRGLGFLDMIQQSDVDLLPAE